jgi:hypothetical protein
MFLQICDDIICSQVQLLFQEFVRVIHLWCLSLVTVCVALNGILDFREDLPIRWIVTEIGLNFEIFSTYCCLIQQYVCFMKYLIIYLFDSHFKVTILLKNEKNLKFIQIREKSFITFFLTIQKTKVRENWFFF